jgi:hypothetical protein
LPDSNSGAHHFATLPASSLFRIAHDLEPTTLKVGVSDADLQLAIVAPGFTGHRDGLLATGTILTVRAWPLTPLHFVKIATSLVAVGCALICTLWVFERRQIEDVNVLLGFRRRIWTLAAVAMVFASPALYLGLVYFME